MKYQQDKAHVISEIDARSGVTGHNVRAVLAAGLSCVVVGLLFSAFLS